MSEWANERMSKWAMSEWANSKPCKKVKCIQSCRWFQWIIQRFIIYLLNNFSYINLNKRRYSGTEIQSETECNTDSRGDFLLCVRKWPSWSKIGYTPGFKKVSSEKQGSTHCDGTFCIENILPFFSPPLPSLGHSPIYLHVSIICTTSLR